jgi:hypothetical protein
MPAVSRTSDTSGERKALVASVKSPEEPGGHVYETMRHNATRVTRDTMGH